MTWWMYVLVAAAVVVVLNVLLVAVLGRRAPADPEIRNRPG
jgi:hypothetical protein